MDWYQNSAGDTFSSQQKNSFGLKTPEGADSIRSHGRGKAMGANLSLSSERQVSSSGQSRRVDNTQMDSLQSVPSAVPVIAGSSFQMSHPPRITGQATTSRFAPRTEKRKEEDEVQQPSLKRRSTSSERPHTRSCDLYSRDMEIPRKSKAASTQMKPLELTAGTKTRGAAQAAAAVAVKPKSTQQRSVSNNKKRMPIVRNNRAAAKPLDIIVIDSSDQDSSSETSSMENGNGLHDEISGWGPSITRDKCDLFNIWKETASKDTKFGSAGVRVPFFEMYQLSAAARNKSYLVKYNLSSSSCSSILFQVPLKSFLITAYNWSPSSAFKGSEEPVPTSAIFFKPDKITIPFDSIYKIW